MKEIALIHTVQSVAVTFGKELSDYLGEEVKIYNLWDQFLSINPNEVGEFTKNNQYRLLNDVKNAELTGADIIVISCSTLTPHIKAIRPYISGIKFLRLLQQRVQYSQQQISYTKKQLRQEKELK